MKVVTHCLSARLTEKENFHIDSTAGLISLARALPDGTDFYILNVTAYDDGSCCGKTNTLSNESYIIVQVVDVNTHKPTFEHCDEYSKAKVKEHTSLGGFVLQVSGRKNLITLYSHLLIKTRAALYRLRDSLHLAEVVCPK